MTSRVDVLEGTGLADRFSVVAVYQGGEGVSAAVRDTGGSVLFLKILDREAEAVEGSLLASLRHPRIPAVLETGRTDDGRAFLLREHVDGVPLATDLPLTAEAAVELAKQLLEVLAYVHLRGILHLDIKPANVIRRGEPDAPEYVLVDFGLGRRGIGPAAGGTRVFAAPERLMGLVPDARSDLFSLGVLLWVALRGTRSLPHRALEQRFPRESFLSVVGVTAGELPAPFDRVLPRLLARQATGRYADAQDALEALVGGSGRPSLELLRPDAIGWFGDPVLAEARSLPSECDLVLEGGDAQDRRALATHVGCSIDVLRVEDEGEWTRIVRGGREEVRLALPDLDEATCVRHLEQALGLGAETAVATARALLASGVRTPGQLAERATELVEKGVIQPHGPRWVWPDAEAGRFDLDPPEPLSMDPTVLRRAASRGHVHAVMRVLRTGVGRLDAEQERAVRHAVAEGLLAAGEPGKALPLVHDEPRLRCRALLDLGQIRQAAEVLAAVAGEASGVVSGPIAHVAACIDNARGDLPRAIERLEKLADDPERVDSRIVLGLALARRGDAARSIEVTNRVLAELDETSTPFLFAAAATNLAQAERLLGDLESARDHHEVALRLSRTLGHVRHTATASLNLGVIAKDVGSFDVAREHLRRARALFDHVHDSANAAVAEANLGVVSLEEGDPAEAGRRLEQALVELETLGADGERPLVLALLARAHAMQGEVEASEQCIRAALALAEGGRVAQEVARARHLLENREPVMRPDQPTEPVIQTSDVAMQMFIAVNRKLASESDPERAMQFLLDTAVTLSGGRAGYLVVADPGGLRVEVRVGGDEEVATFSRSLIHRAIQRRQTLTGSDAQADRELSEMSSVRRMDLSSAICVPFFNTGLGIQGAIYVEHQGRPNAFGHVEKARLDVLADQAAIAVALLFRDEAVTAELEQSRRDLLLAKRELGRDTPPMLGESEVMHALRRSIEKIAPSDLSVLILGETGTGKELVARQLHHHSLRARGNFVSLNCSAIPEALMESELFGHRKGAFTGADDDRPGLLELADGGTLFLDEVGDMPLSLQAKLLRVLQEQRMRRVGDTEERSVDVRVVAATHRDVRAMIESGDFRSDLYYRLAAAEVTAPPLRDRGADIVLLAREFLSELNRKHRREVTLTEGAELRLTRYRWPGNVRELGHVVARAFILADGDELSSLDLGTEVDPTPATHAGAETEWPVATLAEAEARTIRAALAATGGDKSKAAGLLGISRTGLYQKLRRMESDGR